jgi:hypothetical protein
MNFLRNAQLFIHGKRGIAGASLLALAAVVACSSPSSSPPRNGQDVGDGFPQCTTAQSCVGYPAFGDWICLVSCGGPDAGGCPSGTTCKSADRCCTGTTCSATAFVCVASDANADGGKDGASDASSDADDGSTDASGDADDGSTDASSDASDGASDASSDANDRDADGGFPQCTTTQRCVGYPSFGNWVCLEGCSGLDAGDCPSGMTCKSAGGCCAGTACSTAAAFVCAAP